MDILKIRIGYKHNLGAGSTLGVNGWDCEYLLDLFYSIILIQLPQLKCFSTRGLLLYCALIFCCFFLAAQWHMEFPAQGSDQSHNCDLYYRCGNMGSLTHCTKLGLNVHPGAADMLPILVGATVGTPLPFST